MANETAVVNKLELYPVAELKRRLRVNDAALRTMRREGLPVIRLAGRAFYAGEDVIEFLRKKGVHGRDQNQAH